MNTGAPGLKGYVEQVVPWVGFFLCLAYHLELLLKEALNGTLFSTTDEMLMRVYYLYHRSPTMSCELYEVIASLQLYLEHSDIPHTKTKGNWPLHAYETRFVTHKATAISGFFDQYDGFLDHLISLTEDSSVKPADKQKNEGL